MVQDNFDKFLIDTSVKTNVNVKNKALYELSNATTPNQKTIVRKRKKAILDKIKNGTIIPPGDSTFSLDKLSSEGLEKRLCLALDIHPYNPTLLRTAIEFYIKVKGKESEMEEEIDMEVFRKIGVSSPTDN